MRVALTAIYTPASVVLTGFDYSITLRTPDIGTSNSRSNVCESRVGVGNPLSAFAAERTHKCRLASF